MTRNRKIICIVGPTASGKTGWGVEIARKFSAKGGPASGWNGAEIISADSRQIYCGLDIGTGKEGTPNESTNLAKVQKYKLPLTKVQNLRNYEITNKNNRTIKQLNNCIRWIDGVPQWLVDIVEPEERFTMFDWLERARKVVEDIFNREKLPIVIGGTGLYVQALVEGFMLEKSEIRMSKSETSKRQKLERKSKEELQRILKKLDPVVYEQIDKNNSYRLIRAIERAQAGEMVTKKKPNFKALQIAIDLPREELYKRIDQRIDEWFERGFVGEVIGLLDRGVDPKWLEKIGLEYRLLTQYLTKNLKLKTKNHNLKLKTDSEFEEMKQEMKFAVHSYARRQLTWFRRFPEIIWCKDLKSAEEKIRKFLL